MNPYGPMKKWGREFRPARMVACLALLWVTIAAGPAQILREVHSFSGVDGNGPSGGLVALGSTLYGVTSWGGSNDKGTVFKVNTDGSGFAVLKHFTGADGQRPIAGLAVSGTTLFGTTYSGGTNGTVTDRYGTIFRLSMDGSQFSVLRHFAGTDGSHPRTGLVASGPTLYGTALGAGGYGLVFKMNLDGTGYAAIKQFTHSEGGFPSRLVLSGSRLYGTASRCVFALNTDGSGFAILKAFAGGSDGDTPSGGFVLAGSTLYGTTTKSVFKINTDGGGFRTIHRSGGNPELTWADFDGLTWYGPMLYGTIGGWNIVDETTYVPVNSVLRLNPDGSDSSLISIFTEDTGWGPRGDLTAVDTALYGTIISGGASKAGSVVALTPASVPDISIFPQTLTIEEGGTAEFTAFAAGAALNPSAYQWFFNSTNALPGAEQSFLRLSDLQVSQSGSYSVVISNAAVVRTSVPPASLSVVPLGSTPVATCTEGALRAALAGSNAVTFSCDGVIRLSGTLNITKDTVIEGSGRRVTISGDDAVRVFKVHSNASLTLSDLSVADGLSPEGGGIYNEGNLTILGVTLTGNNKRADYFSSSGGAIHTRFGTLNATNSTFAGNMASAGGGIFSDGTSANLHSCSFRSNTAVGVGGGALFFTTNGGGAALRQCSFSANSAFGNEGGGAVHNGALLRAVNCSLVENSAFGMTGADTVVERAEGNPGGPGRGGAVCNLGSSVIEKSLFAGNLADGGLGGRGGPGISFPIDTEWTRGGPGGRGGDGLGGALFAGGMTRLANCTFACNQAVCGRGGEGGPGGVYIDWGTGEWMVGFTGASGDGGYAVGAVSDSGALLALTNCTIASNLSSLAPLASGSAGIPLSAVQTSGGTLVNTLLAANSPSNAVGLITDLGHNLSSDASCAFTSTGSLNNTDPLLGPLADNGGPTLTMALLPGSPAIDAGDTIAAPPVDQRGVPRTFGQAADIGAFEYWLTAKARLSPSDGGLDVLALGIPGQTCCLLISPDLTTWTPTATNQIGPNGTALFHEETTGPSLRFYRLMLQ